MTPDERRLINDLFERMRGFRLSEKDREAEALIAQAVRAMPDAPYMLVQSVLVQEQALEAANGRVQELEARLRDLEGGERPSQGSGSFLGGLFGGGVRPEASPVAGQRASSSVPAIGSRAGGRPSGLPVEGAQPLPQQQPAQSASGGFMRSAMATAAGVAGGMLLAEGIRNMMGGSGAHASPANATNAASEGSGGGKQAAEQAHNDDRDPDHDHDNAAHEAADDGGDWGGDWGGDLDV